MSVPEGRDYGSFRDPAGHVFKRDGTLFRQVNSVYKAHYERLMSSGLYDRLASDGLLIPHAETDDVEADSDKSFKVLRPKQVPFISYPYEWSFSQLHDAALLTLRVQETALRFDMSLKDATAFNVQFLGGKPVLIDTLSFEIVRPGEPWPAYRQFCRHFLAPLALTSMVNAGLGRLARLHLDGIPLDLTARLLPLRARLRPSLLSHIFLHARFETWAEKRSSRIPREKGGSVSERARLGILDSLRSSVSGMQSTPIRTVWSEYYRNSRYSAEAFHEKQRIVRKFLDQCPADKPVWDLGANIGLFSRMASQGNRLTLSLDSDPEAVDQNYRITKAERAGNVLPLLVDLLNPSPSIGWNGRERKSIFDRIRPDATVLALALIHHLAIGQNLDFQKLAKFFRRLGGHLIVEFVPKEDSQVRRMLRFRDDIFKDYHEDHFRREFEREFTILKKRSVGDTGRLLYLMQAGIP